MQSTLPTALLASLLIAVPTFGSTAVSEPAGFTRQQINPGLQTAGITLNNKIVASATIVASEARAALLDPACANLAAVFDDSAAYYAEIVGDTANTFAGDRFDIDVEATRASADPVLFFKDADHNSTALALSTDALVGHRVVIRKHLMIADVFGAGEDSVLHAGFRYEEADSLLFFDRLSGGYATYYLCFAEDGTKAWRKAGSFGCMNDTIIPPATGVFVQRNATVGTELVLLGSVRTNDFVLPLRAGYNFVSSPYPVADATADLQLGSASGFTAASEASKADQILVFNGAEFDRYYLRDAAGVSEETWLRSGGDAVAASAASLLSHERSVFIKKLAADPDFVVRRSFL
ncbi:MAG: hypothetical protein ACREIA_19005 [Opitutaceae bacterium]